MKLLANRADGHRGGTTMRRLLVLGVTVGLALGGAVSGVSAGSAATTGSPDWPAYLKGAVHNSYAPLQQAITSANAAKIVRQWHDFPGVNFQATPTVADNAVFIGSSQGWFYKLKATTGAVLHKTFLGVEPKKTCSAMGIVSTATIANDPTTHKATVYVAAPNGYLYALQASNLALEWRSVIAIPSAKTSNYFDWSSPTVAGGTIYVGVASGCDNPLIQGGVISYDQANGKKIAEFNSVPTGKIGGSVWSSVAVAQNGDVYASTGNGPETSSATQLVGYSDSIVKLSPKTLQPLGWFQIPLSELGKDADFGASPVIVGNDVGACDKNGYFYMLSQTTPPVTGTTVPTMTLLWHLKVGETGTGSDSCIAAPAVATTSTPTGATSNLYLGAVGWTIGTTTYRGSVQERNATTGAIVWQTGLGGGVLGSVAMDGAGVATVPVYSSRSNVPSLYLIDTANGKILKGLQSGEEDFSQGVFAENMLFSANVDGVYGWRPPS